MATWRYETNSRIGIFPGHIDSGTCLASRQLDFGPIAAWQMREAIPGRTMFRELACSPRDELFVKAVGTAIDKRYMVP
ncbi:hypothetical protein OKW40_001735 [Paraburkholderia sp. RAU6.4a]